jgi:guanosine-3',5'-bis(diphosphate) 3'-pyrophosphohydrolase
MTDNKLLEPTLRKQLQIEHAASASPRAKLVKLADKTCNLRDLGSTPPPEWSAERRREYFDWAEKVVAGLRGTSPDLEAAFDAALSARA